MPRNLIVCVEQLASRASAKGMFLQHPFLSLERPCIGWMGGFGAVLESLSVLTRSANYGKFFQPSAKFIPFKGSLLVFSSSSDHKQECGSGGMTSAGAQCRFGERKCLVVTAMLRDVASLSLRAGDIISGQPSIPLFIGALSHEELQHSKFNVKQVDVILSGGLLPKNRYYFSYFRGICQRT